MRCLTVILASCLILQVVTSAAVIQEEDHDSALVSGTPGLCKCGPDMYESQMVGVGGPPEEYLKGSFHIDVKKQRLAVYHNITMAGGKVFLQLNVIVRDKYAYTIIPSLKQCIKNPNLEPISSCISKDAKHTQSFNLGGAGGATIRVDGWRQGKTENLDNMLFSADKCVMTLSTISNANGTMAIAYNDAKLGIKDQSVFNLPPYCKKAVDEEAIHDLTQELFEEHQARQRFFE